MRFINPWTWSKVIALIITLALIILCMYTYSKYGLESIVSAAVDGALRWEEKEIQNIKDVRYRDSKVTISTQESIEALIESQASPNETEIDSYDARNPFWKMQNGLYELD